MSGEEAAAVALTTTASEALTSTEVVSEIRAGWVKSTDGRFHEVEDIDLVLRSYPGHYEEVKASEVKKTMVGWPSTEEG